MERIGRICFLTLLTASLLFVTSCSPSKRLSKAVDDREWDKVKELLNEGADSNIVVDPKWDRTTVLIEAADYEEIEIVELALKKGADVNAKDDDGITALHKVAWNGSIEIAKLLLKAGAEINVKEKYGRTPLLRASDYENKDMVIFLIKNGADVNTADDWNGTTPLMEAAKDGTIDIVKALVENNAELNTKDKKSQTAIILAAKEGNIIITEYLLAQGADIAIVDEDGQTYSSYMEEKAAEAEEEKAKAEELVKGPIVNKDGEEVGQNRVEKPKEYSAVIETQSIVGRAIPIYMNINEIEIEIGNNQYAINKVDFARKNIPSFASIDFGKITFKSLKGEWSIYAQMDDINGKMILTIYNASGDEVLRKEETGSYGVISLSNREIR